jgi:inorganic pyrophosphatase
VPKVLVDRLVHYFTTYKLSPGAENRVSVVDVYDRKHARLVIEAAVADYTEAYDMAPPTLRF